MSMIAPTFGVISKPTNHASYILTQIIDKNYKQQWAQHWSPKHTTRHRPPVYETLFHYLPILTCMKSIVNVMQLEPNNSPVQLYDTI